MSEPTKRTIHTPWFDYEVDAQKYDTMCADFAALNMESPEWLILQLAKSVQADMEAIKHLGERYFAPFHASLPGGKLAVGIVYSYPYQRRYAWRIA